DRAVGDGQHVRYAVELSGQCDAAGEDVVGGRADALQRREYAVEQRHQHGYHDEQQNHVADPPQCHQWSPQLVCGRYGRKNRRSTRPSAIRPARSAIAKPLALLAEPTWSGERPRSIAAMRSCMLLAKSLIRTAVTSEIMPRPYCAAAPDSCRSCVTSTKVA